jgi:glycosyltransferase involved in cell wall biosynthesis
MNNEQPFISFCFTTYKRPAILRSTMESIRLQSFTDYEVIVSDNDPDQSGRQAFEGFDARFKYFPNEQNLGMKKSFNKSLERSLGKYIVMIADDDPVYPDMLDNLVNLEKQNPGYGLYLGGSNYFFTNPVIAKFCGTKVGMNSCLAQQTIDSIRLYDPEKFLKNFFDLKIFPAYLWSCGMVKRDIIFAQGGIPDYDTPFLGDYAYLSIMGSYSGAAVINRALGHQTVHEQNFGRAQNEQLLTVAKNFIPYVTERIKHVNGWPAIEKSMHHFVASWLVTHLTFLKNYFHAFGSAAETENLKSFEKEMFDLPLMKPYRKKYWLKQNSPVIHNLLVSLKKRFS